MAAENSYGMPSCMRILAILCISFRHAIQSNRTCWMTIPRVQSCKQVIVLTVSTFTSPHGISGNALLCPCKRVFAIRRKRLQPDRMNNRPFPERRRQHDNASGQSLVLKTNLARHALRRAFTNIAPGQSLALQSVIKSAELRMFRRDFIDVTAEIGVSADIQAGDSEELLPFKGSASLKIIGRDTLERDAQRH